MLYLSYFLLLSFFTPLGDVLLHLACITQDLITITVRNSTFTIHFHDINLLIKGHLVQHQERSCKDDLSITFPSYGSLPKTLSSVKVYFHAVYFLNNSLFAILFPVRVSKIPFYILSDLSHILLTQIRWKKLKDVNLLVYR